MSTQLDAQRKQTVAFINLTPTILTLTSVIRTKTASGGWKNVPDVPRDPQTFALLRQTTQGPPVQTQDGNDERTDYVLMGAYDAAVEEGDFWQQGGKTYRVHWVSRSDYVVTAGVSVHASS